MPFPHCKIFLDSTEDTRDAPSTYAWIIGKSVSTDDWYYICDNVSCFHGERAGKGSKKFSIPGLQTGYGIENWRMSETLAIKASQANFPVSKKIVFERKLEESDGRSRKSTKGRSVGKMEGRKDISSVEGGDSPCRGYYVLRNATFQKGSFYFEKERGEKGRRVLGRKASNCRMGIIRSNETSSSWGIFHRSADSSEEGSAWRPIYTNDDGMPDNVIHNVISVPKVGWKKGELPTIEIKIDRNLPKMISLKLKKSTWTGRNCNGKYKRHVKKDFAADTFSYKTWGGSGKGKKGVTPNLLHDPWQKKKDEKDCMMRLGVLFLISRSYHGLFGPHSRSYHGLFGPSVANIRRQNCLIRKWS